MMPPVSAFFPDAAISCYFCSREQKITPASPDYEENSFCELD
jgi:hypothetical protein